MPVAMPTLSLKDELVKNSLKGPVYAQLAAIIKQKISTGEYKPGCRIPTESNMSQAYGVAIMTVRQAVQILTEQGILRKVHGKGTYVCGPDWTQANFSMEGLLELLTDRENLNVRILKAEVVEANPKAAESLGIETGSLIIILSRLAYHKDTPILLNKAHLRFDPRSPVVESEMEASSLFGLFTGEGNNLIKKSALKLEPCILTPSQANLLKTSQYLPVYKIRYIFFGYGDEPVGSGWFMTPMEFLSFTTKIGVWDDIH
jgi:GntR family transcriptional regulator